jgi:GDPmannose 4,6-dehydratase
MYHILQQEQPDDYVIGTGEAHSVQEFVEEAFSYAGLDWQQYVEIDRRYLRPLEVDCLVADPTKARKLLNWHPQVTFKELVRIMVDADLEAAGLAARGEGKRILQEKFGGWHQWDRAVSDSLRQVEGRAVE